MLEYSLTQGVIMENVVRVSKKFNQQFIVLFDSSDADNIFLGPLGITQYNFRTISYESQYIIDNELVYFRALHYLKYKIHKCIEFNQDYESWMEIFECIRNQIVSANMSLVYDCFQKSSVTTIDRDTLVSEGYLALISAAELFDPWRGYKFSTYACRAIFYRFSAAARKNNRHQNCLDITEIDPPEECSDKSYDLYLDRVKIAMDKANLTGREKTILMLRFPHGKIRTLRKVSDVYGLSKERVRQIQVIALQKIEQYLKVDPILK